MIPIGEEDRRGGFPIAVWSLILANIAVFVRELEAPNFDRFVEAFALIPYDVTRNIALAPPSPRWPPLTLLTSQFLHGGLLHILANMLVLSVFGPHIEALTGTLRFLVFYLTCGVLGGVAQMSIAPHSHVPTIGASGAIAGVLGAYILRFPTSRIRTIVPIGCLPIIVSLPAILVIGLWIAAQVLEGTQTVPSRAAAEGGTAYFAHIGGFVGGVFLIRYFSSRRPRRRRKRFA